MTEIATSVVGKVVDSLFGVAKKEISYMWNCTENVEKFKNEVEKLKVLRGKVQQQIDIANSKGDNLSFGVQEWVDQANVEISKAEEFLEQEANAKKTCFKLGMCGNCGTLYHNGKKATKMTPSLLQHQERGTTYESCVSVDTPAPGPLDVYRNKNLDDIVTQNSALGDIIEAIKDESIQIIGIYGLGGVGKTTLAKEVVARVKNLFADVAFTTVLQTVNVEKTQNDIGEATKQIMKGEKILIILDDVWEKLDLEELCIPCGINHMNCKILLTSRSEDVCNKMNAQSKICVESLPIEEAWILFKRVVGERVETDITLKEVAMKVAEECGGLPLLIQAVGNALKDRRIDAWNSALTQLKKHAPSNIDPDIKKAFIHLKLSYDYLESEEAKSCFLLCSMYPEDEYIKLEELVHYQVGLAKFNDLDSMEDARQRVQNAVNMLTSSGLLLNVDYKEVTKMHDVVRDVALLIASQGKNKFLVEAGKDLTEWLRRKNAYESYTGISLMYNKIRKLPDYEIHFPHLDTLLIQRNYELSLISEEFIGGMKEVKVLDMALSKILSLPQSLKLLTKLRMLNLGWNESLQEISILGELKDLEILILNETGIKEIPKEIGQLINLRRLEVKDCKDLSRIAPRVISRLRWLEELCIGVYRKHARIKNSIVEIMNLSKLTYLELRVPCLDVIPQGFNSGKLKGFVIEIREAYGSYLDLKFKSTSQRCLFLGMSYLKIPLLEWIKNFIEVSPAVVLQKIENLNNILPTLYDEGFNKLEHIELDQCENVSCLVDTREWDQVETFDSSKALQLGEEGKKTKEKFLTKLKTLVLDSLGSLEVLWNCPDQYISLSNLITLTIFSCHKLVRLFSVSVAQGLVNLQMLSIEYCDKLEEVIWGGDDRGENFVFPCLAEVSFTNLPSLKSFCCGNSTIKYPSLKYVSIEYCISMNIWGPGIHETPELKFLNDVPLQGPYAMNDVVAKFYEAQKKRQDYWSRIHSL